MKINAKTINGIKSATFYTEQKGSGATWFKQIKNIHVVYIRKLIK